VLADTLGTENAISSIMSRNLLSLATSTLILCCGGAPVAKVSAPPPSEAAPLPRSSAASTPSSATPGEVAADSSYEGAHKLTIEAVACWLGGVWSDAEGVDEETRAANAQRRCQKLVRDVYGSYDQERDERLRALDPVEVSELKRNILDTAGGGALDTARAQQLSTFIDLVADAERETVNARRAGDRVKKDIDGERVGTNLTDDEAAAVEPLSEDKAFEALLRSDLGDLSPEARAVAVLCAMDRMETARGLTKHLKVYAIEGAMAALFNAPAADVPRDAHRSLKGGAWLSYLTTVANVAGHPVPKTARSVQDRELLAWGGVLDGLADKLRLEAAQISDATELKYVAEAVVRRLDTEFRASQASVLHPPGQVGSARRVAGRL
jgi:hypothetical protein